MPPILNETVRNYTGPIMTNNLNPENIDDYIYEIGDHSFIRLAIGYDDNIEEIKNGLNELIQYINNN